MSSRYDDENLLDEIPGDRVVLYRAAKRLQPGTADRVSERPAGCGREDRCGGSNVHGDGPAHRHASAQLDADAYRNAYAYHHTHT